MYNEQQIIIAASYTDTCFVNNVAALPFIITNTTSLPHLSLSLSLSFTLSLSLSLILSLSLSPSLPPSPPLSLLSLIHSFQMITSYL